MIRWFRFSKRLKALEERVLNLEKMAEQRSKLLQGVIADFREALPKHILESESILVDLNARLDALESSANTEQAD